MKALSKIKYDHQLKMTHVPVHNGHHCPMHTVLASMRKLPLISSLVVGTPECGFYSRMVVESVETSLHYTYILDEHEVVFGCREGVESALKSMFEEGAQCIILLKTCIPSLIGEDFEWLETQFPDGCLHVIDVAHFKTIGYGSGYSLLMSRLASFVLSQFASKSMTQSQEGDETLLLGQVDGQSVRSLEEILGRPIETVSTLDQASIEKIFSAKHLLVGTHEWEAFASTLAKSSDKSITLLHDVYRIEILAERLELTLDNLLEKSGEDLRTYFKTTDLIKAQVAKDDLSVAIGNGDLNGLALAETLLSMGFDVPAVHIEYWDEGHVRWQNVFKANQININVGFWSNENERYQKHVIQFKKGHACIHFWNRMQCMGLHEKIGIERFNAMNQMLLAMFKEDN